MKLKKELDVDLIGGHDPLTKEEEKAISIFIQNNRQKAPKRRNFKHKKEKVKA